MKFKDILYEKKEEYKYLEISRPVKDHPVYIEYVRGKVSNIIYYMASDIKTSVKNNLIDKKENRLRLYTYISKNPPKIKTLKFWNREERSFDVGNKYEAEKEKNINPEQYLIITDEKISGKISKEIYFIKRGKTKYYQEKSFPDIMKLKRWAYNETLYRRGTIPYEQSDTFR